MRIFRDMNVSTGSFATRGLSADVVRLLMAKHKLLTGEVVLEEARRVLSEKFRGPEEKAAKIGGFCGATTWSPRRVRTRRFKTTDSFRGLG